MPRDPFSARHLRRWLSLAEHLRDELPIGDHVYVWRWRYVQQYGSCQVEGGKCWLKIARRLSWSDAVHTLGHEWAHGLAWDLDADDHGMLWGLAESTVYRAIEQWEREG